MSDNKNSNIISGYEPACENSGLPSLDAWLNEARSGPDSDKCGMYLFHTGVVRSTPKAVVRSADYDGNPGDASVSGMEFSFDREAVEKAIRRAKAMPGIFHIRVWINKGRLQAGDPLMLVLVGGDIRPRVISALEALVEELKSSCITETEIY